MAKKKRCTEGRTDPALWDKAKAEAKRIACANNEARCKTWDGRMAQDAAHRYQREGGEYCGRLTKRQKQIVSWKRENWSTYTGEPACKIKDSRRVCDRYLPNKAWMKLTKSQRKATRSVKLAANTRYVRNAPAARKIASSLRHYIK